MSLQLSPFSLISLRECGLIKTSSLTLRLGAQHPLSISAVLDSILSHTLVSIEVSYLPLEIWGAFAGYKSFFYNEVEGRSGLVTHK